LTGPVVIATRPAVASVTAKRAAVEAAPAAHARRAATPEASAAKPASATTTRLRLDGKRQKADQERGYSNSMNLAHATLLPSQAHGS
jgi:hypothetical protein